MVGKRTNIGAALAASLALVSGIAWAQTPARTSPGGANQRVSLEGCVGEYLFNGIWRLKVLGVRPFHKAPDRYNPARPGYAVSVELRNGTRETLSPAQTGFDFAYGADDLIVADGTTYEEITPNAVALKFRKVPQAGVLRATLEFYAPEGTKVAQKATKLLMNVDFSRANAWQFRARYTTPTPSFRVNLTCQK